MKSIPKYRKHPNGQAFVKVLAVNDGRPYYLGRHNSPESKQRYRDLLDQLAAGLPVHRDATPNADRTITEVIARFLPESKARYTRGGKTSKEHRMVLYALRCLTKLYGELPAREFDPPKLKEFRRYLMEPKTIEVTNPRTGEKRSATQHLCRRVVNRMVNRVKLFFRWASSEKLVPPELYHGLLSVEPLSYGQYGVKEIPDVEPVARTTVETTLLYTTPVVSSMVRLQLECGMRPQDVCAICWADIDTSRSTWIYIPRQHKNTWRQSVRRIAILPHVQYLLEQYSGMPADKPMFSPRTSIYMTGRQPRVNIHDHYDPDSYGQAIRYALKKAAKAGVAIPRWFPYQLRHTRATEISQQLGEQAAQVFLGHERLDTTGIYAARELKELLDVAGQLAASLPPAQTATWQDGQQTPPQPPDASQIH